MNVFEKIKTFLPSYLGAKGYHITNSNKLLCFNPKHHEKTPSLKIYPNNSFYCFGCGIHGDIFDACSYIEGLPPRTSPDFFEGNVRVMAERFGVKIGSSFSKDKTAIINNFIIDYSINHYVPQLAKEAGMSTLEYLKSRDTLNNLFLNESNYSNPIATFLPHAYELERILLQKGFSKNDIKIAYIAPSLFPGPDFPIYPFWISTGLAVGFSMRKPEGHPKYFHSQNTSMFHKSSFLYNWHLVDHTVDELYIVEGQKDAWWVKDLGATNAVACLGSAFSDEHLNLVVGSRIKNIILGFDNDKAGKDCTLRTIPKFIAKGIIPKVKLWHNKDAGDDREDPNICNENILKTGFVSSIRFYIDNVAPEEGQLDFSFYNPIFQTLAAISSSLIREEIAKLFADELKVNRDNFLEDLYSYIAEKKAVESSKLIQSFEQILVEGKKDPFHFEEFLRSKIPDLETLSKSKVDNKNNNYLRQIHNDLMDPNRPNLRDNDITLSEKGLKCLSDLLHKDGTGWTEQKIFLVNGDPHTGKTLTINQFMVEGLKNSKDTMFVHYSTDDPTSLHYQRLQSAFLFHPNFKIADVYGEISDPSKAAARDRVRDIFDLWVTEERLVMHDAASCFSFMDFLDILKHYREKYPERTIIGVNDNFHRNFDYPESDNNSKLTRLANALKQSVIKHKFSFIASVEPVKKKKDYVSFAKMNSIDDIPEPTNDDIADARALMFHADVILHTVNDYILRGSDLNKCVWVHSFEGTLYPRMKLKISKNKISGHSGHFIFDMYPQSSIIRVTDSKISREQAISRFNILKPQDPEKGR